MTPIVGDITTARDRARLVAAAAAADGQVIDLVNNAGVRLCGPIELLPVDEIRRTFEVNLFAHIALVQAVVPLMRARQAGRIINISSAAGRIARPISSIYDATKRALEAVSDGLRGELAAFGVRVIVVQPGKIWTEIGEVAADLPGVGPYHTAVARYLRSRHWPTALACNPIWSQPRCSEH